MSKMIDAKTKCPIQKMQMNMWHLRRPKQHSWDKPRIHPDPDQDEVVTKMNGCYSEMLSFQNFKANKQKQNKATSFKENYLLCSLCIHLII